MTVSPIAPPAKPQLRDLLNQHKQEIFGDFNCHQVGKIVSFDATKQTASVQLQILAVLPDGSQVPYPLLTDCPVFINGGGGATITFPITAGDTCLVLFNDRNIDNWFTTGNVVAPNDSRAHSLSDGLVLVGFRNASNPVASYSSTDVVVSFASSLITIKADGTVTLSGSGGHVTIDTAGKISLGAGTTLKSALDDLCSTLTSWVNTGGSTPNPATVAAIAVVKAEFDAILS